MENAPAHEMRVVGVVGARRCSVRVHDHGLVVSEHFVTRLIESATLVRLKTVKAPDDAHRLQCTISAKRALRGAASC